METLFLFLNGPILQEPSNENEMCLWVQEFTPTQGEPWNYEAL